MSVVALRPVTIVPAIVHSANRFLLSFSRKICPPESWRSCSQKANLSNANGDLFGCCDILCIFPTPLLITYSFSYWKFPSDKVATLPQTLLFSKDLPSSHDWLMLDKRTSCLAITWHNSKAHFTFKARPTMVKIFDATESQFNFSLFLVLDSSLSKALIPKTLPNKLSTYKFPFQSLFLRDPNLHIRIRCYY